VIIMTKIAIHQPNYLPGLGFFRKAAAVDVLILLDTADFSRDSYTQRTKIRTESDSWRWLTVPVSHIFYGKPIREAETPTGSWGFNHFNFLENNYRRCEQWDRYSPRLIMIYSVKSRIKSLPRWNYLGIVWLMDVLGICTKILWASDLIKEQGGPSQTLCELVQKVGGDVYLSGSSGKKYLDEAPFENAGIKIEYHEADPYPYSALDYLIRGGEPLV
jgi:hypothetical protein